MTELLYNIFGDADATRNVTRTPKQFVYNNENIGKSVGKNVQDGPTKPQEAIKKTGAIKKSFLSNAGKALQGTPVQQTRAVFAPTPIYSDADCEHDCLEELEFTRPPYKRSEYQIDIFEDSFELGKEAESPQRSPTPKTKDACMEFDNSYEDDFFTDNILMDMGIEHEDNLPKIY